MLLAHEQRQGIDVSTLANATIRAASKMFADLGFKYSQDDGFLAAHEAEVDEEDQPYQERVPAPKFEESGDYNEFV